MNDTLAGLLLIAMPQMPDPRFHRSVIYMCAHDEDGAMGLIVNKPAPELKFRNLLAQLDILPDIAPPDVSVYFGGPVESGRGFVLHSDDYNTPNATLRVSDGIAMTATLDVLMDMAEGAGPDYARLALGYAGWGSGQIEAEMLDNAWLTCPADTTLIFNTPDDSIWQASLRALGIDPLMLSGSAGHA